MDQGLRTGLMVFRSLALLGGGIFLLWRSGSSLHTTLTEKSPTTVHLANWETEYHGQQWITLYGVATPKLGTSTTAAGFVPVMADGKRKHDAIRAVIVTQPQRQSDYSGPVQVEGLLAPSGAWDLKGLMPHNRFDAAVICLNPGSKPDSVGTSTFLLGLGVVITAFAGWLVTKLALRGWNRVSGEVHVG
jgi:hypothetical protein